MNINFTLSQVDKLLNKFIALLLYNTFQNGYFFIEKSSLTKFSEILDPNLGKY